MARKKKGSSGGGGSWLDTYADMVTLLLTFFVMLYSMSSVSEENLQILIKAFTNPGTETAQIVLAPAEDSGEDAGTNTGDPVNGEQPTEEITIEELTVEKLYEYLKQYVEANDLEASVEVNKGEDQNVFIKFSDSIFFNPDNYILREDSYEILDFLGEALVHIQEEIELVMVAGHTARVDGYYPVSDWRLSGNRASSVIIYFEEEKGFPKMKLSAVGHGAKYPIADNADPEGRKENRRVEIMIVGKPAKLNSEEVLDYFLNGTYDDQQYPATGDATDIITGSTGDEGNETSSGSVTSDVTSEVVSEPIEPPVVSEPTTSQPVASEPTVSEPTVPPVVNEPVVSSPPLSGNTGDLLAPPKS